MKIYIAGSSKELELCQSLISQAKEIGYEITHDWTLDVLENNGESNPLDISREKAQAYASKDLDGIDHAHILWLVCPTMPTRGAWVELGYALALLRNPSFRRQHVYQIVASGFHKQCIFTSRAHQLFDTHREAIGWLKEVFEDVTKNKISLG